MQVWASYSQHLQHFGDGGTCQVKGSGRGTKSIYYSLRSVTHPFQICAFSGSDRVRLRGGSKVCNTAVERDPSGALLHAFCWHPRVVSVTVRARWSKTSVLTFGPGTDTCRLLLEKVFSLLSTFLNGQGGCEKCFGNTWDVFLPSEIGSFNLIGPESATQTNNINTNTNTDTIY